MEHQHKEAMTPHVLIFPLPIQGPINCKLQLAELLCLSGLKATFVNTIHNQERLLRHTNVQTRFEKYPGFRFLTIPDGLPEEHPRSFEHFGDIMNSAQTVAEPFLREMLRSGAKEVVTCVIPDALSYYVADIGNEMGVPVIPFDTLSPSCVWVYTCLPKLIESGELPFKDNDLDASVIHIPAMEGLLRRRDLPPFCHKDYKTDPDFLAALKQVERIPQRIPWSHIEYI